MTKLDRVTSRATCYTAENVNTDQIIPARFLKRIDKEGFGDLFSRTSSHPKSSTFPTRANGRF
jgi:3-isopropylmalate/(R)-2-methylmalate dehydratase small subunit